MASGLLLAIFILELLINVVFFGGILGLLKYWKSEEVRVRGKSSTVFGIVGSFLLAIMLSIIYWYDYDLNVPVASAMYLYSMPVELASIGGSLLIRTAVISFKFQITKEQIHLLEVKDKQGKKKDWFSRHRYLIKERYQSLLLFFWTLLSFIPVFTTDIILITLVNVIMLGIVMFVIIGGFYNSRSCQDFWGIKKELQRACALALLSMVFALINYIVLIIEHTISVSMQHSVFALQTLFIHAVAYYPMILRPFVRARKIALMKPSQTSFETPDHASRGENEGKAGTSHTENQEYLQPEFLKHKKMFVSLLKDPKFKEAFQAHLMTEFSSENLAFVDRTHALYDFVRSKNLLSKDHMEKAMEEVRSINETFVVESSPLWVNLSSKVVEPLHVEMQRLESQYELLTPDSQAEEVRSLWISIALLYQKCAFEATEMMEQDSFRRFKFTPAFKTYQNQQITIMVMTPHKDKDEEKH
jgi:hypothetical protein